MNQNFNSAESFNELVFENRNKEYGAYVIRKSYNDSLTFSLVLTSLFFGLLTMVCILLVNNKAEMVKIISLNEPPLPPLMREVILPIPKKPEPIIEQKKQADFKTDNGQLKATDDKTKGLEKLNIDLKLIKMQILQVKQTVRPLKELE